MNHAEENADWMVRLHEAIIDGKPAELAPEELPDDPLFVEQIRHCLTTLENLRWSAVETKGEHTSATESLGLAAAHSIDHQAVIQDLAGQALRIGRFDLVREIGRGGHGIVYLARDPVLKREVAIKILSAAVLASPQLRKRFVREGQAAAALRHPNILAVYEAGEAGSTAYLVQAYCRGPNLATWLREQIPSVTPRVAAQITRQLAHGVEHSHSQGVLHRDLKPGNVLLEPCAANSPDDLSFVPQLVDFGLARFEQEDQQHTRTGTVLGTTNYMAPEQVRGVSEQIGRPTDVYGLGAILYELLTGTPPFQGDNYPDTFRRICEERPIPPTQLRKDIPADLTTICFKALEKNPADRYASAREMADDLTRFLDGRPILARPLPWLARIQRWTERNAKWVAVGSSGLLLATILLLIGIVLVVRSRHVASIALSESRAVGHRLAENLYFADMALAYEYWDKSWTNELTPILAKYQELVDGEDWRGYEWSLLNRFSRRPTVKILGSHHGAVTELAVSSDRTKIASIGVDGTLCLWDAKSGHLLTRHHVASSPLNAVAFSHDGQRIAVASKVVYVVELKAGVVPRQIFTANYSVESLAFSSDDQQIAAGIRYDELCVMTLDGQVTHRTPWFSRVESLEFVPGTEKWLVPARQSNDRSSRQTVALLEPSLKPSSAPLAWSVDGAPACPTIARALPRRDLLAVGERYGSRVSIVDLTGGLVASTPPYRAKLCDLDVSPDGNEIAAAYENGEVRRFQIVETRHRDDTVRKVTFLDDQVDSAIVGEGPSSCVRFIASNKIATAGSDGAVKVWDWPMSTADTSLQLGSQAKAISLCPDGSLALVATSSELLFLDGITGECRHRRSYPEAAGVAIAWSLDGNSCFHSIYTERVGRILGSTGDEKALIELGQEVRAAVFSPNGHALATIGDKSVQVNRTSDGQRLAQQVLPGLGLSLTWSPSGKEVVYGGEFNSLCVADATSLNCRLDLKCNSPVTSIAFSPSGSQIASGHQDGSVCIWQADKGTLVVRYTGHELGVRSIAFAADGMTLLTSSDDGSLRVASTRGNRTLGTLLRHRTKSHTEPCYFSLSAGGQRLALCFENRTSRDDCLIWNIDLPTDLVTDDKR